MNLQLILKDGSHYKGESFGYWPKKEAFFVDGEVVFNTGMVGYPESLTDPSYSGQILVLTYPLVGNYGVPSESIQAQLSDHLESGKIHIQALIVSEYCQEHSHWKAEKSLADFLKHHKIPAIQCIDTRTLTQKLREHGVMLGKIVPEEVSFSKNMTFDDPNLRNLIAEVSCTEKITYKPQGKSKCTIAMYDCGIKHNIIHSLVGRGATVIRLPWNHDIRELKNYDGLFISNGPGDPKMADKTVEAIQHVMEEGKRPIFGICMGNQLLALAAGGNTYKLKYGHRSANQPCIDTNTGRCYITSQNHGFAVDAKSLPQGWKVWFKNANDGTVEGIRHTSKPWFSVQFHPEASPGPEDAAYLFDEYIQLLAK